MPRLPATKTAQLSLAVFVFAVLVLDGYAVQRFAQESESLGLAAPVAARLATTTPAKAKPGKGLQKLLEKFFGQTPPVVIPPTLAPPDPVAPPDVVDPTDVLPEDPLPDTDVTEPLEDLQQEEEDLWLLEEEEQASEDIWAPEDVQPLSYIEQDLDTDLSEQIQDSAVVEQVTQKSQTPAKKVVAPRVTGVLPDLFVKDVNPLSSEDLNAVAPNQAFGLSLLLANSGAVKPVSFVTRIRVDDRADGSWDQETIIPSQGVLPGNNTQRMVVASAVKKTVSGTTIVEICVDSDRKVSEANEKNNCRTVRFTVAPVAQTQAPTPTVINAAYKSVIQFLGRFVN